MFNLNIEQFSYYKLQEASDFLNIKHNTQTATPIKLLKKAIENEVRLFVYGRGFNVNGDHILASSLSGERTSYSEMSEAEKLKLKEYNNEVSLVIDNMLSALVSSKGAFIEVNNEAIETLPLTHRIDTNEDVAEFLFMGILPVNNPKASPHNLDFIQAHLSDKFNDKLAFTIKFDPRIEVFYDTEEEFDIALTEAIKECSLKVIGYSCVHKEDNKLLIIEPYFEINLDDLIILDDDLIKLEQFILGNKILEETQSGSNSIVLGKKGLSAKKSLAQHIAKHIAEIEWQADKDKKIRMSDMTDIVWAKLYNLGLIDSIPDQPKSLKSWIKDIAPDYASEGGRPRSI